ncbi:MAG: hypothetical protein IJW16_03140 [Clostridia bacterium]|nr:hypothetical protein [Clostridia bacterium]
MARKANTPEKRAKLLVCILGKEDELRLPAVCNECAVSLHFSTIAFGTARSNYISYLGLDEIEKRITYSLIPNYCENRILRAINKKLKLYLMGKGIAFTVPLSGISNIVSNAILSTPYREEAVDEPMTKSKKEKKQMHELIVAVVNQKYTDKVLDASRAAGATGATILHSRSIGNKQAEQVIGTSLSQESDTIAFLTAYEYKNHIMEAIRDVAGLKTDGTAVIFSLPVDSLIGIGRFADEEEE